MPNRFGREHDQEIIGHYQAGSTAREIAQMYGTTDVTVYGILRRHGIPTRRAGRRSGWQDTEANRREVVTAYVGGKSVKTVAKQMKCRDEVIMRVLNESGVTWRHVGGRRRFTDDEAAAFAVAYESGESLSQVAERYDANPHIVRNYLIRAGVEMRPFGAPAFWTDARKAEAVRRFRAGEQQKDIRLALGCGTGTLTRMLRHEGVLKLKPAPSGEASHAWRGGRVVDGNGYIRVRLLDKDRHLVDANRRGYVMEHRLVMARQLGRPLLPDENVHHRNGVKTDNDPGNLELWVKSQPAGQRVEEIVEWATYVLKRYAASRLTEASTW